MIETTTYIRKPFEVEAVQVTKENMEEVKNWCQGTLQQDGEQQYIKVQVARALHIRQTKAFPGDWVLYAGTGFKVYTNRAFRKTFELLEGEARDEVTQASKERVEDRPITVQNVGDAGGSGTFVEEPVDEVDHV